MNIKQHLKANREKQANYARYLLNLTSDRRMSLLEKMKPALREKMEALMVDQKAKNIASLVPEVRRMYLTQLKRHNPIRYELLLLKVAAYESAVVNL
jgi:Mg/Co/Ni transporter MgtE